MSNPNSTLDFPAYSTELGADFARLNYEWLEKYFAVEPPDRKVLGDPEGQILKNGGRVLFARLDGAIVGTCALINEGDGVYELAKMAVVGSVQGRGIGARLLEHALDTARGLGARRVRLETSRKLLPALHLYEKAGFQRDPEGPAGTYERADVAMYLDLT